MLMSTTGDALFFSVSVKRYSSLLRLGVGVVAEKLLLGWIYSLVKVLPSLEMAERFVDLTSFPKT